MEAKSNRTNGCGNDVASACGIYREKATSGILVRAHGALLFRFYTALRFVGALIARFSFVRITPARLRKLKKEFVNNRAIPAIFLFFFPPNRFLHFLHFPPPSGTWRPNSSFGFRLSAFGFRLSAFRLQKQSNFRKYWGELASS
jgi:hypothetical protein